MIEGWLKGEVYTSIAPRRTRAFQCREMAFKWQISVALDGVNFVPLNRSISAAKTVQDRSGSPYKDATANARHQDHQS
jgi:hypothetical protein